MKIFAYVEGIEGRHREGQLLVSRYYDQLIGLTSDPACKDESRLCYFTYSPDGYVASLYQSFVLEAAVETQPFQPTAENLPSPPLPAKANETSENFSEEEVNLFLSSYIFLNPLTAGQRHTNLFKLACEAYYAGLRFILSTPTFPHRKSGASYNLVTKKLPLLHPSPPLRFALLLIRTK